MRLPPWIASAPFSSSPAPSEYDPPRAMLGVLWLANVAAILVVPPTIALAQAVDRPVGRTTVIVYAITWVGSIALAIADPGGTFAWAFLD